VPRAHTTTCCRAFALTALLIVVCASLGAAADHPAPPKLPLARWWEVPLDGRVTAGPVSNGARVYFAYAAGFLVARDAADGHELWRQKKDVSAPMAVEGDLLFVATGDAVEALRGATGASAWIVPRVKTVAPLLAQAGWLIATTAEELIAIHAADGSVAWRHPAGGVTLPPVVDDGKLYTGANDGRVLALALSDGTPAWDHFFPGGVTAIAAAAGRLYVGTGDKRLFSVNGRTGEPRAASYRIGAQPIGHIAVDDEHVYVAAFDNVVRAFDRQNGNQRWEAPMRQRPTYGVFASGHIVFVPASATELQMVWDRNGVKSGTLTLPGESPPSLAPAILDSPDGPVVYVVTGGLTNEWHLTKFAPAGEAPLVEFGRLDPLPGLPFLTDPELKPIGLVLRSLLLTDPPLVPLRDLDWPLVMKDPPLVPLTTLPGLQLRPLSPVLPVRRGGPAPND
jgi:outer membrane protein assembly factor BamB